MPCRTDFSKLTVVTFSGDSGVLEGFFHQLENFLAYFLAKVLLRVGPVN